jgi:alpha-tubulin suppressor-like RCC1 family protein
MTTSLHSSTRDLHKVNADQVKLRTGLHFVVAGLAVVVALLQSSCICLAQTQGGSVVAWGADSFSQSDVPPNLTNVIAIAAGGNQSLALKADGTISGWGATGLSNVVAIALGGGHTLALLTNGTVVAWGDDASGQTDVPTGLSNIVAIAAGNVHSLALSSNGMVTAWGWNAFGQTNVPPGLTSVKAIAGGDLFSLALKSDGTIVGWGYNGDGETTIPSNATNVVSIAAGDNHALALKADGTVVAWGYNGTGQASVPSGLSNVVAIAAGGFHSLAVKSDGTVTAWGWNNYGQTSFPAWLTNVVSVAAGENHSLALVKGGPVIVQQPTNLTLFSGDNASFIVSARGTLPISYQWQHIGTNIDGATDSSLIISNVQPVNAGNYGAIVMNSYGRNATSNAVLTVVTSAPVLVSQPTNQMVVFGSNAVFAVSAVGSLPIYYQWTLNGTNIAGATSAVLILSNIQATNGGIYCVVVSNLFGSVTSSNATLLPVPPAIIIGWGAINNESGQYAGEIVPPLGLTNVVAISAGGFHSLALNADGTLAGWGDNGYGQSTIPSGLSNVVGIAAGFHHNLALNRDGTVFAWGRNTSGQANVPAGLSNIIAVAAGGHSLALESDGTVVGWGPTAVPTNLSKVVAISAGENHSLALMRDGTLTGWGYNYNGQATPPAGLSNVVAISAGGYHSMVLRMDGTVLAWGNDAYGQTDVPTDLSNVVAIAAGEDFSAALRNDGTVIAWGSNWAGESIVPAGLSNIIAIATGARHVLALQNDGTPVIVRQPISWTFYTGSESNITLNAGAVGPAPLSLQWQLYGTNIVGATNSYLIFNNVQPEDSGTYTMVASNPITGATTSSNAVLSVIRSKPIILNQATNSFGLFGGNTTLAVSIAGSLPITYQWQFNGTNIINATNTSLTLSNLGWTNTGVYTLVASNSYGTVVSSNDYLTVLGTDFPTALNTAGLTWTSSGNAVWFPETTVTYDGVDAAQSGEVGWFGSSTLQTSVRGPGILTFWWMFSPSTAPSNSLSFSSSQGSNSATVYSITGWQQRTFYLGAGQQTLTWKYLRSNRTVSSIGLVDQVSFTPFGLSAIPTNLFMSTTGFQLKLDGISTTNSVVIYRSTNLVYWLPLFTNSATTGSVQFLDVSATNIPIRFYRARE